MALSSTKWSGVSPGRPPLGTLRVSMRSSCRRKAEREAQRPARVQPGCSVGQMSLAAVANRKAPGDSLNAGPVFLNREVAMRTTESPQLSFRNSCFKCFFPSVWRPDPFVMGLPLEGLGSSTLAAQSTGILQLEAK